MNYHVVELNDKKYRFKLLGIKSLELEKLKGDIIKYINEETVDMCITLFQYSLITEDEKEVTLEQASKLYDEFINAGWSKKKIIVEVLYEMLVISGFLEKEEWEQIKIETKEYERLIALEKQKTLEALKKKD